MALETIGGTSLAVALPRGHALTKHSAVPLPLLADESFIFYSRAISPGYSERVNAAFAEIGVVPHIVQEVFSAEAGLSFVASGRGVTLIPKSAEQSAARNASRIS